MQEPRTVSEILTVRADKQRDEPLYIGLEQGEHPTEPLSYHKLRDRAVRLAAHLVTVTEPGDRVLLLFPGNPDFMVALFACFYAGLIAVPAPPLNKLRVRRTLPRLTAMVNNAQPTHAIAAPSMYQDARSLFAVSPELEALTWIELEGPPESWPFELLDVDEAALVQVAPQDLAYLQYTSGSTSAPKGVAVTHANLMAGGEIMGAALELTPDDIGVTWLPNFHDMGLVNGLLQPLHTGFRCYIMDPVEFVQRPARWLEAFSRFRGTFGGAPNMGFELLLSRVSEAEREALDLSSVRNVFNGAEPIRPGIVAELQRRYAPVGLRPDALSTAYGLAEATLMVSAHGPSRHRGSPHELSIDDRLFSRERRVRVTSSGRVKHMSSSGWPITEMAVVDVERRERCPEGVEGEIWVGGPIVAAGYFRNKEATEETFKAYLANGDGPYMRTGDLAFLYDGELYISGRSKDVIIVAGTNHYPQDIELSAGLSHPAARAGCCAAFGVEQQDGEAVVVVVEVRKRFLPTGPTPADLDEVINAVREMVSAKHELAVAGIALIKPGSLFKTSSGKIQRRKTRAAWLDGSLDEVARWQRGAPAAAVAPAQETAPPEREVAAWLQRSVARIMGMGDPSQVGLDEPFQRLGLTSLNGVELSAELAAWLGRPLPATLLWAHPTIAKLVRFVAGGSAQELPAQAASASLIAIVGIGCRFPGADGKDNYWRLLADGVDAITEVPADRFDVNDFYDRDPAAAGKLNTRFGGFIDQPDRFDAGFFGISPREAACMDPQQRVLLEVAWDAIDDAGLDVASLAGSRTGVFVGATTFDYGHMQMSRAELVDGYMGTGTTLCILANRISYLYDLRGPSLVVDTACSSSLVSVHMACESLRNGEATVALAGGVNLIFSPLLTINASKLNNMARDGRCKTFDARADGAVRSEGAGMVVLKPLEQALADGDRVYAVIRATATNQDGRSNGLMAPNPQAQRQVLQEAYRRAGIAPRQVQYIEAHGTGTLLGDPIEAQALGELLGEGRAVDAPPVAVGSVKSNIGHTEAAAGIAGLIKVALSLHHDTLPPSLHFETPNPHIPFDTLPLRVTIEREPWPDEGPRYAGVSAFGWGGTNAHAVLSAAPSVEKMLPEAAKGASPDPQLLLMSARSKEALRALAQDYRERFATQESNETAHDTRLSLLRSAAVRRTHHPFRLAAVAPSPDELVTTLDAWLAGEQSSAAEGLTLPSDGGRTIAFIYPGSGWQWRTMGRELLQSSPVFAAAMKRCDEAMATLQSVSPSERLMQDGEWFERTETVQPVLFAVQVALTELWRSWGVAPAAVLGHSMGEPAAAWACGALTLEQAALVACKRAAQLQKLSGTGAMALVEMTAQEAEQRVAERPDKLAVAVCNSPRQTVIAGELSALDELLQQLEAEGVFCRRINADGAGHCHYVDPLAAAHKEELAELAAAGQGEIPFYSPVTAGRIDAPVLDADYWASNLRQTVRFAQATEQLLADGYDTVIEMSAHPVLCGAVRRTGEAAGKQPLVLGSGRRDQDLRHTTKLAAAKLYAAGHRLDYGALYPPAPIAELPRYPWQRQRHWFDDGAPEASRGRAGGHLWLSSHLQPAHQQGQHLWEVAIALSLSPWLRDHALRTTALVPGVCILQLAMAALTEVEDQPALGLSNIVFEAPLVVPEQGAAYGQLLLERVAEERYRFSMYAAAEPAWQRCAGGELWLQADDEQPAPLLIDAIEARCQQRVDPQEHYQALRDSGICYGPAFRGLTSLRLGQGEAFGGIADEQIVRAERRMDACLHTAMAVVGGGALPVAVERLRLWGSLSAVVWSHAQMRDDGRINVRCSDARGRVLLQVDGLQLEPLAREEEALSSALFSMQWQPAEAALPEIVGAAKRVLLLGDETEQRTALRDALKEAVGKEGEVAVVSPERFATDPRAALEQAFAQGCEVLAYCAAIDSNNNDLASACTLSMGHPMRLVQALTASTWRQHPRLYLLSRGAVSATADGPDNPAAAPLWGMARTIRHEHPELRCSCIEMGPGADVAGAIARELLADDIESEVAYDAAGMRHVLRLLPHQLSPRSLVLPATASPHTLVNRTPGALDGLGLTRAIVPQPGPGKVLVETRAAALNFRDVMKALNVDIGATEADAQSLGDECAGVIAAVGEGVTALSPGDEVIAIAPRALASQVLADSRLVVRKPATLSWEQAAALPIATLTAHLALSELARIRQGERVLIHSAAGGVGMAAVKLCQQRGAVVYATAGSPHKREQLRALGVEAVFHSRTLTWAEEVREATRGEGVDVVLNSLAGEAIELGLGLLRPGGRFLEIGRRDIAADRPLGMAVLRSNVALFGVDLLNVIEQQPARAGQWLGQIVAELAASIEQPDAGSAPLPVRAFRLDEIEEAFRVMARGEHIGKLVLRFGEEHEAQVHQPAIVADGSYLISGGLGGIGRTLARWLVDAGARHIALMSRRQPSAELQQEFDTLTQRGVQVRLLQADVSSAEQVRRALDSMADMPPLMGVFHAAVSLADSTLLRMTDEHIEHVSTAKIDGAYNLHHATLDQPLAHFCMFSSAAAVLGSPGQGNYAGANAYLDALVQARHAAGKPALSVSWGTWAEVGGAADAGHDKRLAMRGMEALDPEAALRLLGRLLLSQGPCVTVAEMRWRHYFQSHPQLASLPFFADVQNQIEPTAEGAGLQQRWQAVVSDEARKHLVQGALCRHISRVLKVPDNQLGADVALSTLGFDSLTALELRNRLEADLGLQLSATLVWSHPTVGALAGSLHQKLHQTLAADEATPAESDAVEPAAAEPTAFPAAQAPEGDHMSEAERRLEAKLAALEERLG